MPIHLPLLHSSHLASGQSSHAVVEKVMARPLNVPLINPFVIATSEVREIQNVLTTVHLNNGIVGYGEASVLPHVTEETQPTALAAIEKGGHFLLGKQVEDWDHLARGLSQMFDGGLAGARASLEMALLDALAQSQNVPLYKIFGNAKSSVFSDITIPICSPSLAEELAKDYAAKGYLQIKTKVGKNLEQDIQRMIAIRQGHPDCEFILDANEGYTADEALRVIRELKFHDFKIALFEQPVHRDDRDGMAKLTRESGILIAADESCRSVEDAKDIIQNQLAHVINIKLVKQGVEQALQIVRLAREAGVALMIGGMVETRVAMGFSAHFAAGLGGFPFIDLDTPQLLKYDPVVGSYDDSIEPILELGSIQKGMGIERVLFNDGEI